MTHLDQIDAFAKRLNLTPEQHGELRSIVISAALQAAPPIADMVNRFLGWKLPKTFSPDAGISFTPIDHPACWPIGTNLLSADEARAMFEHACAGTAATTSREQ